MASHRPRPAAVARRARRARTALQAARSRATSGPTSPSGRVSLMDVLGVPVLPPGRAVRTAIRLRASLARLHRALAPPPARIVESALGILDLAVLAGICRLDLPDRVTRPTAITRLATELEVDPARLRRLVRAAATRGWLRLDTHDRVRATRLTPFLRRDHPGGWRAWVEFASGEEIARALAQLDTAVAADGDAFATANGSTFFSWMQTHPQRHAAFDAAMSAGARMHGLLLAHALDWSSSRRVCDIGGGDGTLLDVLLNEHAHLQGVLLELPEVAARARMRDRLNVLTGDAFTSVPGGCDTYLLVNVVHDWDDEAALTLLRRAADAAASGSPTGDGPPRVVVVDAEVAERPRDDLATSADMVMLALTPGGHERTTREVAALAARAGLQHVTAVPLASGDLAHVLTPSTDPA